MAYASAIGGTTTALGYQQILAATLAVATSLTVPAGATIALISVGPAATAVRWRDDGTAPTASVGMSIAAGTQVQYSGSLSAIQFILQTGSPILDISYYK